MRKDDRKRQKQEEKTLDPRVRKDDRRRKEEGGRKKQRRWILAFARMTEGESKDDSFLCHARLDRASSVVVVSVSLKRKALDPRFRKDDRRRRQG